MNESLASKQEVQRWVTQLPYHLQPLPGSSSIDWSKVEVVPAYAYDSSQAELARLTSLFMVVRDDFRDEVSRLRTALKTLRARPHLVVEDCWYSCPLSEEGCCDHSKKGCTCGIEKERALIDEALRDAEESDPRKAHNAMRQQMGLDPL